MHRRGKPHRPPARTAAWVRLRLMAWPSRIGGAWSGMLRAAWRLRRAGGWPLLASVGVAGVGMAGVGAMGHAAAQTPPGLAGAAANAPQPAPAATPPVAPAPTGPVVITLPSAAILPPPPEAMVAAAIWQTAGDGLGAASAGIGGALAGGFADIGPAQGAWVANAVLAASGVPLIARAAHGRGRVITASADPFRAHPPAGAPDDARPGLASVLAAQSLGAPQGLALGLTQKFASSTALATDLALRHAAGPLDVNVDVSGAQPLVGHGAMALQYDSHALVAVVPAVQVGVAAKGPLGTIADVHAEGDQTAGPLMRLHVEHRNLSFSTDAGYDFHLNPAAAPPTASERFHVKVGVDIKL